MSAHGIVVPRRRSAPSRPSRRQPSISHPGERRGGGAEGFGEAHVAGEAVAVGGGEVVGARGFDVDGEEVGVEACGHAFGGADETLGHGAWADSDDDAFASGPDGSNAAVLLVAAEFGIDPGGGAAEGEFAEGGEVAFAEEAVAGVDGEGGGLAGVDLAGAEAIVEDVGGEIDEFDLVGFIEDAVGDGFLDFDACDLGDDVVEGVEVLNVEGGVDVDAGAEAFADVLPSFFAGGARGVGVGELVDEQDVGTTEDGGVGVELSECGAGVGDLLAREDVQAEEELFGLGAFVGLDDACDDIDALGGESLCAGEHGEGLADAGGHAEEDFELAAWGRVVLVVTGAGSFLLDAARSSAGSGRSSGMSGIVSGADAALLGGLIQVEVQFKNVDDGFAEEAEGAVGGVLAHEGADRFVCHLASLGNAGELVFSGGGGDVGVQAAGGGGDEVDGDALACGAGETGGGVSSGEGGDACVHVVEQCGVRRGEVAAGGACALIEIEGGVGDGTGCAGAAPEPCGGIGGLAGGELLADEGGADGEALGACDDRAVGAIGEGDLGDGGDGEGVNDAGEEREGEEEDDGWAELIEHG